MSGAGEAEDLPQLRGGIQEAQDVDECEEGRSRRPLTIFGANEEEKKTRMFANDSTT